MGENQMRKSKKIIDDNQMTLFDQPEDRIIHRDYSDIMKQSYIDYSMSVIVSRAVPDIRDGLKPVQRRILYDMGAELKLDYNKPYRKSARIVGDTMGKFHPHGDSSIYDAMVVMSQNFKRQIPLVDGHGNFGSIEGDGAAASRYTEARLQKIAQENYLFDIDKNTVNFVSNYDETEKEPEVLPVKIPNFLINGSEGIAVGMATSTPSHNLVEVLKAEEYLMMTPGAGTVDLMDFITGPDFPTGGIVANAKDLVEIYNTGIGKIRIRGKVEYEKTKQTNRLIITEIPYTMIGAGIGNFLNDVAALVDSKVLPDVVDISNQSSKEGIKIVLDLKKSTTEAEAENIKNILFNKTKLEDTFGVNMLAIVDGRPETVSLKSALENHINFLYEINTRKYQTLLDKENSKKEIQEGLIKAIDILDAVIETIRGSKNRAEAKKRLMEGDTTQICYSTKKIQKEAQSMKFTESQADAILNMQMSRLCGLELDSLKKENGKTLKNIEKYTKILSDKKYMKRVIKSDLESIIKEYGAPRKTQIENIEKVVVKKEEKKAFKMIVLIDRFGYIRAISDTTYEKNKEAADKESKWVAEIMSNEKLSLITADGMLHNVNAEKIPFGKFRDKSIPVDNISTVDTTKDEVLWVGVFNKSVDESIDATNKAVDASEKAVDGTFVGKTDRSFVMVTNLGGVKKIRESELTVKSKNTKYIKLKASGNDNRNCETEKVVLFGECNEMGNMVLVSEAGKFLRFAVKEIPEKKRAAGTVVGIALKDGEVLSDVFLLNKDEKEIREMFAVCTSGSEIKCMIEAKEENKRIDANGKNENSDEKLLDFRRCMNPPEKEGNSAVDVVLKLKNGKSISLTKLQIAKRGQRGTMKKI